MHMHICGHVNRVCTAGGRERGIQSGFSCQVHFTLTVCHSFCRQLDGNELGTFPPGIFDKLTILKILYVSKLRIMHVHIRVSKVLESRGMLDQNFGYDLNQGSGRQRPDLSAARDLQRVR